MEQRTMPISVELLRAYEDMALDGSVPSLGESVTFVDNKNSIEVHNSKGKIALVSDVSVDLLRNFNPREARITRIQLKANKIQIELKK